MTWHLRALSSCTARWPACGAFARLLLSRYHARSRACTLATRTYATARADDHDLVSRLNASVRVDCAERCEPRVRQRRCGARMNGRGRAGAPRFRLPASASLSDVGLCAMLLAGMLTRSARQPGTCSGVDAATTSSPTCTTCRSARPAPRAAHALAFQSSTASPTASIVPTQSRPSCVGSERIRPHSERPYPRLIATSMGLMLVCAARRASSATAQPRNVCVPHVRAPRTWRRAP